ncbi:hypothetical protein VaNZ11_015342 [Volvox africanus]|uniref:Uncharacterized protein n=1 Tax=Volvox africanus TaxID=51714 RepID=A0ABQ5SLT1_9CHLO|nr:hypothetical protein VaNZ11_015342 [Volvox africanus]
MGKLDPSQQDRWWKSRIEKEELQYGLKQEQSAEAAKPATKEFTVLNTLGQPQVKRVIADPQLTGAGAILTPRDQQPSRPPTAGPPPPVEDTQSVASAAKPVAIKVGSVASQPRTNKGSQAGTESQSALAKRLDLLEEALAAERVKRLQAEEEMRQLMALQQQHRKKVI